MCSFGGGEVYVCPVGWWRSTTATVAFSSDQICYKQPCPISSKYHAPAVTRNSTSLEAES